MTRVFDGEHSEVLCAIALCEHAANGSGESLSLTAKCPRLNGQQASCKVSFSFHVALIAHENACRMLTLHPATRLGARKRHGRQSIRTVRGRFMEARKDKGLCRIRKSNLSALGQ